MVDDHPENLLALEAVLSSPNYRLVTANSGKDALKCLLKQDFAIILLDVQMPGLNGFETAKLIRAREKTKHTPIIFITAISQDSENVQHGYSVGAIDYIFKPFQPEVLKQKIEKFVELHQKYEEKVKKSERKRTVELQEITQKLDQTSSDLRRTEALNRVIGETLMDSIITFDEQGFILSGNPALTSMFGYQPNELIGENISRLFLQVRGDNEECSPHILLSFMKQEIGKVIRIGCLTKGRKLFSSRYSNWKDEYRQSTNLCLYDSRCYRKKTNRSSEKSAVQ